MGMTGSRRRLPPTWLFGLVGLVVIGGFAFGTYRMWSNDSALAERGQRVTATVVDTAKRDEVEFRTPDGAQVRALVGQRLSGPELRVGEEVQVVYDPADPSSDVDDVRATDDHSVTYLMLGVTIAAAVSVPLATWRLSRAHRRAATT